ncbi:hypothetical protein QTP88_020205 [Uroleucon formosanum]
MSKQRVFDIFNFTKPQPDKLTSLNKPKLKSNSDNDSDSVDSELLALSSFSSSTSCLYETDYESTSYKNLLKNDEKIDLGDLQSGPIRSVLKDLLSISVGSLKAEMIAAKNVIIQTYGTLKELTTDNLKLILHENVYPNLFHLYKVAITLPISSSTNNLLYDFKFGIRYLATGQHFSALHFEFLAGVSTIAMIVRETCKILWTILQPIEMIELTTNDWLDIAKDYFEKTQFPNTVGASVQRRGVGNIQKNAKDVREYFVEYTNNPNHALDWQNTIIGR